MSFQGPAGVFFFLAVRNNIGTCGRGHATLGGGMRGWRGGVAHSATFQLHKQCRSEIARGDSFCAARSREPNRLQFFPRDAGKTGFLFYFSGWEIPIIKKIPPCAGKKSAKKRLPRRIRRAPPLYKIVWRSRLPRRANFMPRRGKFCQSGSTF